jgi:hypothetical protein
VHNSQEKLLPKFLEADFCVKWDKVHRGLRLDGFKPR